MDWTPGMVNAIHKVGKFIDPLFYQKATNLAWCTVMDFISFQFIDPLFYQKATSLA